MILFEPLRIPQVQPRVLKVNRSFRDIVYTSNLEYLWDILEGRFSHAINHDDDDAELSRTVFGIPSIVIQVHSIYQITNKQITTLAFKPRFLDWLNELATLSELVERSSFNKSRKRGFEPLELHF